MTTTERIRGRAWTYQIQIARDEALELLGYTPKITLKAALENNRVAPSPRTALEVAAVGADTPAALAGMIWDAARLVDSARSALDRGCEMDGHVAKR